MNSYKHNVICKKTLSEGKVFLKINFQIPIKLIFSGSRSTGSGRKNKNHIAWTLNTLCTFL